MRDTFFKYALFFTFLYFLLKPFPVLGFANENSKISSEKNIKGSGSPHTTKISTLQIMMLQGAYFIRLLIFTLQSFLLLNKFQINRSSVPSSEEYNVSSRNELLNLQLKCCFSVYFFLC